jgi:hypothetical protein
MNKKFKDIGTGVGVAGMSIVASANVIPGINGCTGSCGACGLTCLVPIAGIASVYIFSITRKKIKLKSKGIPKKI